MVSVPKALSVTEPAVGVRGGRPAPGASPPAPRPVPAPHPRRSASATSSSRAVTAASASIRRSRPAGVSARCWRRRSPGSGVLATSSRATSPSMTAVTLGGLTVSRSASRVAAAGPSASSASARYCCSDSPIGASPCSTWRASRAIARPAPRAARSAPSTAVPDWFEALILRPTKDQGTPRGLVQAAAPAIRCDRGSYSKLVDVVSSGSKTTTQLQPLVLPQLRHL